MKTTLFTLCLAAGLCSLKAADAGSNSNRSTFTVQSPPKSAQLGGPKEITLDDGSSAGKRSIAGSGHIVKFTAPAKECYLTGIRLYGSRYGYPKAPAEDAHFWLCDSEMKVISSFAFPYSAFERGEPKWVTIPVKPMRVPEHFQICAGFNPTSTKGVYVHHDASNSGASLTGLPGAQGKAFDKGDWMIRAVVQEAK